VPLYLIEESAVKAYYGRRVPKRLWRWLLRDGPIIRAKSLAVASTGSIRFRAPDGVIEIPREALSEAMDE
jgi:hypothetical protein